MTVDYLGPTWLIPHTDRLGLRQLDRASQLVLSGPSYTDEVVQEICRLRQLTSIQLHNTRISPNGVSLLRSRLPSCRIEHRSS